MEMKSIDVSVWSWDGTLRTKLRKMQHLQHQYGVCSVSYGPFYFQQTL